jgi:hypothetical protein
MLAIELSTSKRKKFIEIFCKLSFGGYIDEIYLEEDMCSLYKNFCPWFFPYDVYLYGDTIKDIVKNYYLMYVKGL